MGVRSFLDILQAILAENTVSVRFSGSDNISLPMLVRRDSKLFDSMFIYPAAKPGAGATTRPHSWLMIDSWSGRVAMLCDCSINDFADTGLYPEGSAVSLEMSRHLPDDLTTKSLTSLYEIYEQLRMFAFEPSPADWQLDTMAQFRGLFLQLTPPGLYPYYRSLAPEFCEWVGLELEPKPVEASEPETQANPADSSLDLESQPQPTPPELSAVKEELASLRQAIEGDQDKNKLLDAMHAELTDYKNGLIDAITGPMENDLIKIIDDIEKSWASYKRKNPTRENYRKMLNLLQGFETDLCDALYRHGMEPFRVEGNEPDIRRQKILAVKPTAKEHLDKKTAQRHGRGWEKNGKIMRPERISVYVFDPQGEAAKADDDTEL